MVLAQAIETLRLASSGVGLIPVVGPYLTSAVDIALQLCEIAQKVKKNRENMEELAEHAVKFLEDIIRQLRKTDRNLLKEREADVADLQSVLAEIVDKFSRKQKSFIKRVWRKQEDMDKIAKMKRKLDAVVARFGVISHMKVLTNVQELRLDIRKVAIIPPPMIRPTNIGGARGPLSGLHPIYEAKFDYSDIRPEPLSSADEQVLSTLDSWLTETDSVPFLWLVGGNQRLTSPITRRLCSQLSTRPCKLGGSFFFSANTSPALRDPRGVVRTLAFQAARLGSEVKAALVDTVEENLDIVMRGKQEQLVLLLEDPLVQARGTLPAQVVFVLDGMHNCEGAGGDFVRLLARTVDRLTEEGVNVKVLVASQDDARVRMAFEDVRHVEYNIGKPDHGVRT